MHKHQLPEEHEEPCIFICPVSHLPPDSISFLSWGSSHQNNILTVDIFGQRCWVLSCFSICLHSCVTNSFENFSPHRMNDSFWLRTSSEVTLVAWNYFKPVISHLLCSQKWVLQALSEPYKRLTVQGALGYEPPLSSQNMSVKLKKKRWQCPGGMGKLSSHLTLKAHVSGPNTWGKIRKEAIYLSQPPYSTLPYRFSLYWCPKYLGLPNIEISFNCPLSHYHSDPDFILLIWFLNPPLSIS